MNCYSLREEVTPLEFWEFAFSNSKGRFIWVTRLIPAVYLWHSAADKSARLLVSRRPLMDTPRWPRPGLFSRCSSRRSHPGRSCIHTAVKVRWRLYYFPQTCQWYADTNFDNLTRLACVSNRLWVAEVIRHAFRLPAHVTSEFFSLRQLSKYSENNTTIQFRCNHTLVLS